MTCTRRMPDNRFVLSVDNGIDQVKIYRFNDKEQRLVQVDAIRCELDLRQDISVTAKTEIHLSDV